MVVVTGIGISPDPTKELLVWEFSADMDPAQCCCWFLQDDFPVFRKEQMNHVRNLWMEVQHKPLDCSKQLSSLFTGFSKLETSLLHR